MWKYLFILCLAITSSLCAEKKVLAFAGSQREGSFNKLLVKDAAKIAEELGAKVTYVDLNDYQAPIYDADLEAKIGSPETIKRLRKLMIDSQVIFIASPEYNGSVSALLKNVIDWASRNGAGEGSAEAFSGKLFVVMSTSPGRGGGARGLVHLRTIIENLGGIVLPQQLTIPDAYNAFNDKGQLKNESQQKELKQLVQTALKS